MIPYKQLTLTDIFQDSQDKFENDKPEFLSLLEQHIDIDFDKVPDASKITRIKQDFLEDLQTVFDNLVDITEPICQAIDSAKADMTIFDSSGIEAFVTENNPKYANRIIKQLKAYAKTMNFGKQYDPYKCAHDSKLLIPTLKDFYTKHPLINPKVFLGDAAFDTLTIYKDLLIGDTFGKARRFSCAYNMG